MLVVMKLEYLQDILQVMKMLTLQHIICSNFL
jgi:hypothetical protein